MSARLTLREAVLAAIPDTWLDDLLTGPRAVVKIPAGCPEIEALLRGLKRRVADIFERYTDQTLTLQTMTLERAQEIVHKLQRSGEYTYLEPTRPEAELDGGFDLEDLEALVLVIRHNQQATLAAPKAGALPSVPECMTIGCANYVESSEVYCTDCLDWEAARRLDRAGVRRS